jgi:hypothetical protein
MRTQGEQHVTRNQELVRSLFPSFIYLLPAVCYLVLLSVICSLFLPLHSFLV